MKTFSQTPLTFALAFGISGALAFGCAKKREASLPEDQVAGTFSVAELQDVQLKVKTTEGKKAVVKQEVLLGSERNTVLVDTQGVPDRFLFLFRNLEVTGKKNEELQVVFGVDRNHVTAYKLARIEDLSPVEKSLALSEEGLKSKITLQKLKVNPKIMASVKTKAATKQVSDDLKTSLALVPLFKFKVTAHGSVEKVKNELKEETSVLKLKKSEWELSTHVQISDLSHERLNVEIDPAIATEAESYLITERIQQKAFSKAELTEILGVEIPGAESSSYTLKVDASSIKVLSAQVKDSSAKQEAILTLGAEQVEAQLNLDKGQETTVIGFKKVAADKLGSFIKLVKASTGK